MLLGEFLPKTQDGQVHLEHADGVLLSAVREGDVVVFDGINLAPASLMTELLKRVTVGRSSAIG